jgi:acyl carrier protein
MLADEEIASVVEDFVRARFQVGEDDDVFGVDVNLWEEGYVDSTGAVELIVFLEQTYSIRLPEEVLFDPDFTCIRGIARLVARTAAEGDPAAMAAAGPPAASAA